jgi:hypothetical protein
LPSLWPVCCRCYNHALNRDAPRSFQRRLFGRLAVDPRRCVAASNTRLYCSASWRDAVSRRVRPRRPGRMETWLAFERIKQYRRLDQPRTPARAAKQRLRPPLATGLRPSSRQLRRPWPHSIPTLPSTSRLSLKFLPLLVAVPCQIPKVSSCSPWTFEYPRASNRDFASRSVMLVAGLIDRDIGGADESVGEDRLVCARAELPINKLNIQIATEGGTRISVSPREKGETNARHFFTGHQWRR